MAPAIFLQPPSFATPVTPVRLDAGSVPASGADRKAYPGWAPPGPAGGVGSHAGYPSVRFQSEKDRMLWARPSGRERRYGAASSRSSAARAAPSSGAWERSPVARTFRSACPDSIPRLPITTCTG